MTTDQLEALPVEVGALAAKVSKVATSEPDRIPGRRLYKASGHIADAVAELKALKTLLARRENRKPSNRKPPEAAK